MPTWLIVFLFALGAVALFVVGMSLTLMIKGHNIDSEISTNKNMQRLGIKCAVHETREADGSAGCSDTHTAGQLLGLRHRRGRARKIAPDANALKPLQTRRT